MSDPKQPKDGYTPLGEHDPCDHAYDYVDGDMDDYQKPEVYDNSDTQRKDYDTDDKDY